MRHRDHKCVCTARDVVSWDHKTQWHGSHYWNAVMDGEKPCREDKAEWREEGCTFWESTCFVLKKTIQNMRVLFEGGFHRL